MTTLTIHPAQVAAWGRAAVSCAAVECLSHLFNAHDDLDVGSVPRAVEPLRADDDEAMSRALLWLDDSLRGHDADGIT